MTASALAATAFVILPAQSASAYRLIGCHFHDSSITYNFTSATRNLRDYPTSGAAAAGSWSSATQISFTQVTSRAEVSVDAYFFGNTDFDGIQMDEGCSGGVWLPTPFAQWNRYYTDGYTFTGQKQVMVHELGHTLGLDEIYTTGCSGQPIMFYDSDRYFVCRHSAPQGDDINGVNNIY